MRAWRSIADGVVAKTEKGRSKYWEHWCTYAKLCGVAPDLQTTPSQEVDIIITGFASRVRTGYYGRGDQVKVSSVTEALAAISTSLELGSKQTPLYRAHNVYNLPIQRCVEGMRRDDPLPIPQLAVPIAVVKKVFALTHQPNSTAHAQTIGDLITIAFFFLLRVGEYTKPRRTRVNGVWKSATRTKQFTVENVGFFKNDKNVSRKATLKDLLSCDSVTLRISNQKNGRMGQTMHVKAIKNSRHCPVKALARRVYYILSNGGSDKTLLCDYLDKENSTWKSVEAKEIIKQVRAGVTICGLQDCGIDPDLVGAHSLRAGGAMAMKLNGCSTEEIMKHGRWRSLTFMMYIHNQIAHLSSDISQRMNTDLPFVNISNF